MSLTMGQFQKTSLEPELCTRAGARTRIGLAMAESFLRKVEGNIAKHQGSTDNAQGASRPQNNGILRPGMPGIAHDPTIPPLRLNLGPPPTQSRYFAPKPTVIAPNSSPDRPPVSNAPYVPHQSHFAQPTLGSAAFTQRRNGFNQDPFAPSTMSHAPYRPNQPGFEPPRKKQNTGRPPGSVVFVPNSPDDSPNMRRVQGGNMMSPLTEEDSPGPNRLRKGRPADYIQPLGSPSPSPTLLLSTLQNAHPGVHHEVLRQAAARTNNYQEASFFIKEWEMQQRAVSISIAEAQEKERREKELAKQRKNKSAIYAHRNTVPGIEAPAPRSKRAHDDSDSEGDDFRGDGFDSDASDGDNVHDAELEAACAAEALEYFNTADAEGLVMMIACTPEQAETIIRMRPFLSVEDIDGKMVRRTGVSSKLFENYKDLLKGYRAVDAVLQRCERYGQDLDQVQAVWQKFANDRPKSIKKEDDVYLVDDGPVEPSAVKTPEETKIMAEYIWDAPQSLAPDVTLKDYQMLGVNWLNLLYSRNLSCILADEMGLGKTIQVIAFLTYLKSRGLQDKVLIVVPASTLENWIREFSRFSPSMRIVSYYGTINERSTLRRELLESQDTWDVMVTTYNFAQGGGNDSKFFKKVPWAVCVYDEGHVLKNYQSQRYHALTKIRAKWRLLLTGTPLQNNLQELLSLMNFILPKLFTDVAESFRAIFRVKPSAQAGLLAHDRVSRAKQMMTPFVLRRRKDQVLRELPKKMERIEWCEMTPLQKEIYDQSLQRSRRVFMEQEEVEDELALAEAAGQKNRPKKKKQLKAQQQDLSSNVLMDLRKATSHPMLFRRLYTDEQLKTLAKECLQEPEFMNSKYNLVLEDMSVMTDAEIHHFCKRYKSVRKYALDESKFLEAGKLDVLLRLLEQYTAEGRRVLIFSQFTQILDILKSVLNHKGYRYLVLTGSTAVDERQGLVDEFNDDQDIKVFLLSTKAGGMGINLTAASVVITYDQDFNPHNDLQAADRAYRIGQQRDVDVIKLITRGTIEEDILQLALTKLQLDEAIAGDEEASKQTENEVKKSLMERLRKHLDDTSGGTPGESTSKTEETKPSLTEVDVLKALPAALLAATRSEAASPASSLLRAEETPPATQSPTPLPTPSEKAEPESDVIMIDD